MKSIYTVLAAVLLSGSAYAVEIDCPPETSATAGQGGDGVTMDKAMLKKRKQARDEELARLKARYMAQTGSDAKAEPPGPDRAAR